MSETIIMKIQNCLVYNIYLMKINITTRVKWFLFSCSVASSLILFSAHNEKSMPEWRMLKLIIPWSFLFFIAVACTKIKRRHFIIA